LRARDYRATGNLTRHMRQRPPVPMASGRPATIALTANAVSTGDICAFLDSRVLRPSTALSRGTLAAMAARIAESAVEALLFGQQALNRHTAMALNEALPRATALRALNLGEARFHDPECWRRPEEQLPHTGVCHLFLDPRFSDVPGYEYIQRLGKIALQNQRASGVG
jgi:hypothetical protein